MPRGQRRPPPAVSAPCSSVPAAVSGAAEQRTGSSRFKLEEGSSPDDDTGFLAERELPGDPDKRLRPPQVAQKRDALPREAGSGR